mmetsp:Transcript_17341/g.55664  ORF Transcript_17341/g.55664 Transcript_17341/m.55664 type:complete len:302 (+) Transcript_17341:211-1116(+)
MYAGRYHLILHTGHLMRFALQDRGIYWRIPDPKQSTEFTYQRFFVPYLANFQGWAMFCDDDFLWTGDIAELIDQLDDSKAIYCVKHDYKPTETKKLCGVSQDAYPRKNWSSMVLYNCGHPANKALDLETVNREGGPFLHRFSWIEDDNLIGEVDYTWNFLTAWYKKYEDGSLPKVIHYTEGGAHFPDYREGEAPYTDYHDTWLGYLREYEAKLGAPRMLGPYERLSSKGNKPLPGYPNSDVPWSFDDNVPLCIVPFPDGKGEGWEPTPAGVPPAAAKGKAGVSAGKGEGCACDAACLACEA